MNSTVADRATWRELTSLALALAIVNGVFLFLADGDVLFTRPLWTDELHTILLAGRSSPAAVLADLANGADYGPPLLHLSTWMVRILVGGLTPTVLRVFSLVCMCGALLVVYALLRRRFRALPSAAGVLAVASHELVVAHSFEARFYGPWLLCAALFAFPLSSAPGRRRDVWIAVASVLLVTVHWYGVVSLGLMVAAVLGSRGARWRDAIRSLAPAGAGLIVFALCIPLAVGQRHALTVNTWVPAFRVSQIEPFARLYWTALVPALALLALVVALLARARFRSDDAAATFLGAAAEDASLIALVALALMPLALAVMSILGQPSMWPRYGIVAVLAWAPLVALTAQLAGVWPARAMIALTLSLWFINYTREAQYKRAFAVGVERLLASVRQAQSLGVPVVFQSMHAMYAAASADWDHRSSTSFLELPDSTLDAIFPRGGRFEALHKALRVERDVARVHSRRFGFPRLSAQAALDSLSRFVLVASDDNLPPGYAGVEGIALAVFPRHRLARLAPGLLLFERAARDAPAQPR